MARIRTIKPEFWTSEQVVACSPTARLLFVGLWNFCDDSGIHPASALTIKMKVLPADPFTIEQVQEMLGELCQVGLLTHYSVESKSYYQVTGWHHQKIDKPNFRYPLADGRIPVADKSSTVRPRNGHGQDTDIRNGKGTIVRSSERDAREYETKTVDADSWEAAKPDFTAVSEAVNGDKPLKPDDRETIVRGVLVARRLLPDGWLKGVCKSVKRLRNRNQCASPYGYFQTSLINGCEEIGVDFHRAASAIEIPDHLLNPRASP